MERKIARPEHLMVRRALIAGAAALFPAWGAGLLVGGRDGGVSAVLGVVLVVLNFAAHGLSLAWAAGKSVNAVQAVALGGFVVRMGVIVGAMFVLSQTSFFYPLIFGMVVAIATVALLVYEARLLMGFRELDIPPDPAAVRAGARLRAREEALR
jgi:hypothetical protein